MKRWLLAAVMVWPLALAAATWARVAAGHSAWADVVYLAASTICHQRWERSFQTAGVSWPVCGRCAGLYLAAPFGAVAAFVFRRQPRDADLRWWLVLAATPTATTVAAEWLMGLPVTNEGRALAALPLGAAIAFVLIRMAPGRSLAIG